MTETLRHELRKAFEAAGETPARAAQLADIAMEVRAFQKAEKANQNVPANWGVDWQLGGDGPIVQGLAARVEAVRTTWRKIVRYDRFDTPGWEDFDLWLLKEIHGHPHSLDVVLIELMKDPFLARQIRSGMFTVEGNRQGQYSLKATIRSLDCMSADHHDRTVPETLIRKDNNDVLK